MSDSTTDRSRSDLAPLHAALVHRGNVGVFHYDNVAALGSQVRRRAVPEAQPRDTDCVGAENVVKDHRGQKLAYVYFEDGPGRQTAADPLTQDEARRIAANIAKLPDLLKKEATMTPPGIVPAPKR